MKLLLLADEESEYLWTYYQPGRLDSYDLIISCGDLKSDFLSFLVTMARCPLLYVCGNHDGGYEQHPPEGCDCIEDRIVTVGGLRILGLGGSMRYSDGPHQYTERQMRQRIRKLALRLWLSHGVDLIVTHAPPRGLGDLDDPAHRGFESFVSLMARYHPRFLVHGHVHERYQTDFQRINHFGNTEIINVCGRCELEIDLPPRR